ncbi:MAG TPA: ABC transporter permease [Candidatus Sulfopaludibacter sp.]|jgi:predicted permease|nr:ABC transporter permease [Candidatus Sulfopaludibacter sp.]
MLQDLAYAVRQLRKLPGFTGLVILTIALGIGANTAIFSCINGFLRPLPARSPEQLVVLAAQTQGDETGLAYRLSFSMLQDLRRMGNRFSDVFAFNTLIGGLTSDGKVTTFTYQVLSGNTFSAMALQPAAGRLFVPGEGEVSGSPTNIVLGYSYWQRRFAGDPRVVGKQVRMDGLTATVIGVAPPQFLGLYAGAEMDGYLPLNALTLRGFTDAAAFYADRAARPLTLVARMKPGVTLAEAQSSVDVITRQLERQYPATDKGITLRVIPERLARPIPVHFVAEQIPLITAFLLILSGLVLLLACMNVANLLLVRAAMRQREMAIRAALGSGRSRLVRQMLTESGLLALLGAAAGLGLGRWASYAFIGSIDQGTSLPIKVDFSFDWRVFSYALGAAVFTAITIGAWPALRASQTNAGAVLHDGARGSGGAGRQRVRSLLVVAQVAGSLTLLIVAGLFVRSLERAQRMNLGFDPHHVLNARMNPRDAGYSELRSREFYRELERRIREVPGVQAASFAFSAPLGYINDGEKIYLESKPLPVGEQPPTAGMNPVDRDYFDVMRIPIVRGRAFTDADTEAATRVAIVNQTMASRFWPNEEALGKRFRIEPDGPLWQVVGVARDSKYLVVFENPLPYFYLPLEQHFFFMRVLQVRTAVPPEALRGRVEQEIRRLDPDIPIADLQTMDQSLQGFMGFMMFRMGAQQAGAMGLLGLILAVIGVYGVVSYGASQRIREIGIRMALGAEPRDVAKLVLGQGVRLVFAGIATGLLGAVAVSRLAGRILFLISTTDPMTFGLVSLLLAGIALYACYIPARRAMRVDPMVALRHE